MSPTLDRKLAALKAAIIAADTAKAMDILEELPKIIRNSPPDDHPAIEARLPELRMLADASARGAHQAFDQMRAILKGARSLQVYDASGRMRHDRTAPSPTHRY